MLIARDDNDQSFKHCIIKSWRRPTILLGLCFTAFVLCVYKTTEQQNEGQTNHYFRKLHPHNINPGALLHYYKLDIFFKYCGSCACSTKRLHISHEYTNTSIEPTILKPTFIRRM